MLFNLRQDIGERDDLAHQRADIVRELRRLLSDWEADVNREARAVN